MSNSEEIRNNPDMPPLITKKALKKANPKKKTGRPKKTDEEKLETEKRRAEKKLAELKAKRAITRANPEKQKDRHPTLPKSVLIESKYDANYHPMRFIQSAKKAAI